MKKVKLIMCLLCLVLMMTGCSKKNPANNEQSTENPPVATDSVDGNGEDETDHIGNDSDEDVTSSDTEEPTSDEDNKDTTIKTDFIYDGESIEPVYYEFPDCNVGFYRPMFQLVNEGYTEVFNGGGYYIAYSFDTQEVEDLISKDVWNLIGEDGLLYATRYYFGGSDGYEVELTSEEPVTISNMDCIKYEGKVYTDNKEFEKYIYGYAFAKENKPNIIGGVVHKDQEQQYIDEMKHNVDEIMKTVDDSETVCTW